MTHTRKVQHRGPAFRHWLSWCPVSGHWAFGELLGEEWTGLMQDLSSTEKSVLPKYEYQLHVKVGGRAVAY